MSCITVEELRAILLGTELSGHADAQYVVSYAVPNSLLGVAQDHNNSGFSFGIVQLDIGVNAFAQQAYAAILNDALSAGLINQEVFGRLGSYSADTRYDLDPALSATYVADRDLLNSTIFNQPFAHQIIDTYTNLYLEQSLLGKVQNFLTAMDIAWGPNSVFDYNNPDYHLAVAAITSIANRFGSLTNTTTYFQNHQPAAIDDVRLRFDALLPETGESDWNKLITKGAQEFAAVDPHYDGVEATISLANASTVLNAQSENALMTQFLKSELGSCVTDVHYTGSDQAAFLVGDLSVPGVFSLHGGLFLSSGGFPGHFNSSSSFSVSYGTPGDGDLTHTAQAAFPGAGASHDAAVVEFTFDNENPKVNGISFDLVFGSDEYPEWSNTSFVDVAAIYVNGVNVALFNNNPSTPLSVTQANVNAGNFLDNTHNSYPIEWDGFSHLLTVRAHLNLGHNVIKIGVADTGDTIYDSGLYVANMKLLTDGGTGGGVLNVVDGSTGNDSIPASLLAEEINLFSGSDIVFGSPAELNGDVITGFGADDVLKFKGVLFSENNIVVTKGSAILHVDTNNDATADTIVTLTGNFDGAVFHAAQSSGNTEVTVEFLSENHAPALSADTGSPHPLTEVSEATNSGELHQISGTLSFTDIDENDPHSAAASLKSATWAVGASIPVATQTALASSMSASIKTDGISGTLDWLFSLADSNVDFLAAGEVLTTVYEVRVADSHSAGSVQDVTIVIAGANDVSGVDAGNSVLASSISELPDVRDSNSIDTTSGTIAFSDPDLSDRPTGSIDAPQQAVIWHDATHDYTSQLSASQIAGFESALQIGTPSGNTNIGIIDWTYSTDDKSLDFLGTGDIVTITTPIVIDDHNGGTVSQNVVITINGTNDNPIALPDSSGVAKGSTISVTASSGVLSNDSDPDIHDHLVVGAVNGLTANVGHEVKGTYGSLTLNADGSYAYTANKGALPAQIVAQDTFNYTVSDGQGGTSTVPLNIVVSNPDVTYRSGVNTTLVGSNGKNVLDGSAGHDVLMGGNGADVLIGGNGDKLTGGSGPDTFLFRPDFGTNVITDFNINDDVLQLDKSLFANVADILSHTTNTAAGAVINDGHGDTITLTGLTLSQLQTHHSDFHLV